MPHIQAIVRDITQRKQAEAALRNEKARVGAILDLVGEPIFVKDNDHRITNANLAFCEMFGVVEKDVMGRTLAESVPENERTHFLSVDRRVLDTGVTDLREEELTIGGFTRTIITRKALFVDGSGNRFLVGSIYDITDRKQTEDALHRQLDELQRWHAVTEDREERIRELKKEVNDLLKEVGRPGRYGE